jgi:O-antigen/teichoic acid export membrane protein
LNNPQSIVGRTITSISWNVVASLVAIAVGGVRSILLARLLPVEVFGTYALAGSIVGLSGVVVQFGMTGAFLHRATETEDEDLAAAVYFTLQVVFNLVWAAAMLFVAFAVVSGPVRTALLLLTLTQAGLRLAIVPRMILVRRVVHRRLALLQIINIVSVSLTALLLAWRGATLWALLATDIVTLVLTWFLLYFWRPVWHPRLNWSRPVVRYFLSFGSRNLLVGVLMRALDQVDDLWTGVFLGKEPLGFYSRAYTFATYPRAILAAPVNEVAGGTYAELKTDRLRLSRAFFRTNAFLIRTGFFLAGILALIAPEFIRLVIGIKWLPMLDAFRLMLVYTLLDPIKSTVASLFVAVGKPEKVVWARLVQLAVMIVGLVILGPPLGITGVAIAVDTMLVVGIFLLLWQAKGYVDFSSRRLFSAPGFAIMAALLTSQGALLLLHLGDSVWLTAGTKVIVFSISYGLSLLLLEREQFLEMFSILLKQFPNRTPEQSA